MKKIMNIIITVLLCFGMITINILPISAFNQSGVIVEKEIYLNLPVDDILQPRASVANDRWKVGEYKDTVRGLTMTANVTLRVTIMVNESTGIITSYRGLAVNTNWVDVDVGKFKYYACVISSESEVLIEPFFFPDNLENFESFF